ncbi:MAG: T9SS type A sorting domain-containing protein [Bacteroidia bacterium]
MKNFIVLLYLLLSLGSFAQVETVPLNSNPQIVHFLNENPDYEWGRDVFKSKWGTKDTLGLPFFEDFTHGGIYPDSSKWLNNQVYINNHFPYRPPSFGVATFDMLNEKGQPINETINKDFSGPGDSLLSQCINLKDSSGTPYVLADSIIFSFFYQPNGYGYHLESEDSLLLFFKNSFNNWVKVWSRGGSSTTEDFKQVMIPIENNNFLHEGFQFLFTTFSRQVGNANQWHIDYITLDKNRSLGFPYYNDYAIQTTPTPLLKEYYEMPFSHFMINPAAHVADSLYVRASGLDKDTLNIQVKHKESFGATVLVNTTFASNGANVPPMGSSWRRLEKYNFYSGLSGGLPIVINREFEIREAGIANKFTANDKIETQQMFYDYFAYDDGTAEQGFGFDHLSNPSNVEGEIAYGFKMEQQDTLYGIGVFFNQAVFDVSRTTFTLRVWQSIDKNNSGSGDVLIYESEVLSPQYTDQINRYWVHYPDTTLVLPAGEFYIGWHQNTLFNLNVGWDRNSGNHKIADQVNPHLYYKLFDQWSNAGLPNGSLMMRPYVGSSRSVFASNREMKKPERQLKFYPNPAQDKIQFEEEVAWVELYANDGRKILRKEDVSVLNISNLPNGMYYIIAGNFGHQILRSKLIIFAP